MHVLDVMECTGLTRKALYYYESIGIVDPIHDPGNGYRVYSREDVNRLRRVRVLRSLDVPLAEIAKTLQSDVDLSQVLQNYSRRISGEIERLERILNIISAGLNEDVDQVENKLAILTKNVEPENRIGGVFLRREILRVFPGSFGVAINTLFYPFLNAKIDSPEKERVWLDLVSALDRLDPKQLPQPLLQAIEEVGEEAARIDINRFWESLGHEQFTVLSRSDQKKAKALAESLIVQVETFLRPFFRFLATLSPENSNLADKLVSIVREMKLARTDSVVTGASKESLQ